METAYFIDAILAGFLTTNLLWLSRFQVDTRHSFEDQTQMSTFLQVSRRPISRYSDVSLSSSVALFAVYDFLGHVSFSTLPTLFAHPDFKIKSTNCYRAISQVFTIKSNMIASFKPLNLLFLTLPWSSRRALHCKHMYVRMTVTFIQPWYKALRSSRSSGTLNAVVSGINACIRLIALHTWPPDLPVQDFMRLLFYRDPELFRLVVQNIFFKECRKYCHAIRIAALFVFCVQKEYFKCTQRFTRNPQVRHVAMHRLYNKIDYVSFVS